MSHSVAGYELTNILPGYTYCSVSLLLLGPLYLVELEQIRYRTIQYEVCYVLSLLVCLLFLTMH